MPCDNYVKPTGKECPPVAPPANLQVSWSASEGFLRAAGAASSAFSAGRPPCASEGYGAVCIGPAMMSAAILSRSAFTSSEISASRW